MRSYLSAVLVACLLALPAGARASDYPTRYVTIIVPYSAGGGVDTVVRLLIPRLSEVLGGSIVVENRPGMSGVIGAQMVARAKPDGYTLLAGNLTTNVTNQLLVKHAGYDPRKDFTAIGELNAFPTIAVVPTSSPLRTIEDLIAAARAKPETLTYGSSGVGSAQHLATSLFQNATGTRMVHVPYKGSAGVINDLIGGQLDVAFEVAPLLGPYVGTRLRALGVTSAQPLPSMPDIVPVAAQGLAGFEMTYWNGLFAPAETPPEIVGRIADALRTVLGEPVLRQKMIELNMIPGSRFGGTFGTYVKAETEKWSALIREAGIQPE